ncbi:proline--tRNA ligase [Campylobacter canadensis]|uniref:Proline--tRNA ligase n=1 Tax=Campylobacter canadensis TaxID=449520 RepID=A0ABS7WSC9_9BACT|nr:proline--tRNA ligase [Campylobacter canadensis]MBZ7987232.1 proline--tRNA ligase [Campylobacter canadensis]MBZ7998339.1 proline--tRNA ligase [Campylobacter canadensis]
MKFTKFYAPTSKNAPKDAQLTSHILLSRAGYIEQLGSGLYNYLPLANTMIEKIKNIVIKRMQEIDANYLNLSFVCPLSYWDESGRSFVFGKELLRFKDRKDNDFILSPTAEEAIVALVRGKITSYKQLPINLFQIQSKFRDEARPRFGLLRGREFIMKDAYSFHSSYESLDEEFLKVQNAYCKILDDLKLNYAIVDADSGAIGGSGSKEFMVIAPSGEDDLAICKCGYCANVEAAKRQKINYENKIEANLSKFKTPNIKSIDDLANFFKCEKHNLIKAVVKKAIYKDKEELIVYFIRGNDELNEVKAKNAANAIEIVDANDEDLLNNSLCAGFIGPFNLDIKFFIDEELKNEDNLICGANEVDYHLVGVKITNFLDERFKDLSLVKQGDKCPNCSSELDFVKGIEVGHIFKLGDKYSKAMNATYLDENGKAQAFIMGCYGVGISRLLAVLAECKNDEFGLCWDKSLSPFDTYIILSDVKNEEQMNIANEIYAYLKKNNINVLFDDRNERFGVKINDYELIGVPSAIIIGKKIQENLIELKDRKSKESLQISLENKEECFKKIKEFIEK